MLNLLRKNSVKSFLLLISLGFTWGTSFSIAKYAMESGITPLGYAFWQSFGPAVLVLILTFFQEKSFPSFDLKHVSFYFFCGLLGIALPNLTMYFSAAHVPSGILGLIVNTSPIITYVFSVFFMIEKFSINRFLGIIFGFVGLAILFLPKLSSYSQLKWMLFALITPILLASCTVFMVKLRPNRTSSLALSCGMLVAATCIISPVTFITHNFHPITLPLSVPNFFIIIEIILSSIGYILFFELLKIAGPVYYSLVGCIVALAGLFWGYIIFDERLKTTEFFSIIFIIISIYLVSIRKDVKKHQFKTDASN